MAVGPTRGKCSGMYRMHLSRQNSNTDISQIINAGDALEFLSGGFYPSTRHRVVQPPADQRNIPRLGVFYFSAPDDDVKLLPLEDSPVLQKASVVPIFNAENVPNMETWRKARVASYGKITLKPGKENGVEEEIISGIVVKHYN